MLSFRSRSRTIVPIAMIITIIVFWIVILILLIEENPTKLHNYTHFVSSDPFHWNEELFANAKHRIWSYTPPLNLQIDALDNINLSNIVSNEVKCHGFGNRINLYWTHRSFCYFNTNKLCNITFHSDNLNDASFGSYLFQGLYMNHNLSIHGNSMNGKQYKMIVRHACKDQSNRRYPHGDPCVPGTYSWPWNTHYFYCFYNKFFMDIIRKETLNALTAYYQHTPNANPITNTIRITQCDIAIHLRCGDMTESMRDDRGILTAKFYLKSILYALSKAKAIHCLMPSTTYLRKGNIFVLTETNQSRDVMWNRPKHTTTRLCRSITSVLIHQLNQSFHASYDVSVVYNNIANDMELMIHVPFLIIAPSTFSFTAALCRSERDKWTILPPKGPWFPYSPATKRYQYDFVKKARKAKIEPQHLIFARWRPTYKYEYLVSSKRINRYKTNTSKVMAIISNISQLNVRRKVQYVKTRKFPFYIFEIGLKWCGSKSLMDLFQTNGIPSIASSYTRSLHGIMEGHFKNNKSLLHKMNKKWMFYSDFSPWISLSKQTLLFAFELLTKQYQDSLFILNMKDLHQWLKSNYIHYILQCGTAVTQDNMKQILHVWKEQWYNYHCKVIQYFSAMHLSDRLLLFDVEHDSIDKLIQFFDTHKIRLNKTFWHTKIESVYIDETWNPFTRQNQDSETEHEQILKQKVCHSHNRSYTFEREYFFRDWESC
eukprot:310997_1